MTVREGQIVALAADCFGVPPSQIDRSDLLGIVGEDGKAANRFMNLYALRFGVNMSRYKWWFHHRDEGVFATPMVARDSEGRDIHIPLSAGMLAGFAERRRWELDYPPHRLGLRSKRWAVVVFGICALGLGYAFLLAP